MQTSLRDSGSDLAAPERDPEKFGPWPLEAYLLANVVDAVNHGSWLFALANTPAGKTKPAAPNPTPRPGAKPAKVRAVSPEGVAYLNSLRAPSGD